MPLEALRYPVTPLGLHYLLIHYDIPAVDGRRFRLEVDGHVERPLTLSLDDLRGRPRGRARGDDGVRRKRARAPPRSPARLSQPWLAEAVGTAAWTGTSLAPLLAEAGPLDGAVEVVFTGLDRGVEGGEEQDYERSLTLEEALRDDVLLAYGMNGAPLLPQHGFPLRLVVPGWYGMTSVKWLTRITVVDRAVRRATSRRTRTGSAGTRTTPATPLTRMAPRALMVPPGLAGFPERERTLAAGPMHDRGPRLVGLGADRARSSSASTAAIWADAELDPPAGRWAWRGWRTEWDATPGEHVLTCRARDEAGNAQPDEADWNVGGYANNGVQRVPVTVA